MAHIRQLPSGNWQAIVYVNGKGVPFTDPSLPVVKRWAADQEHAKRRGTWQDPRLGRITLDEWHTIWLTMRMVDPGTTDNEASTWRTWIKPRWGDTTLEELARDREGVKAWVKRLADDASVGGWTLIAAVKLLRKLLADALDSGRISINPAVRLSLPPAPRKPPFFWTHAEAGAIVAALSHPYDVMVDFDMHVGPRVGELGGLKVDCVDVRLGLIHVVRVVRDGRLREYPKSMKSYRSVPIPGHLLEPFERLIHGREGDAFVFAGRRGAPLNDNNFRIDKFNPALLRARTCACREVGEDGPRLCSRPDHAVRYGVLHDMRHTAASWLVMAGVDLYRVQDLLGHEKITTTQRYAHLDPAKHDALHAAWGTGGLVARTAVAEPPTRRENLDHA